MVNYLGEIRAFAGTFIPKDWALCDGSLLPIKNNEALYSLLGTVYGGDGVVFFALPDLRGRTVVQNGQLTKGAKYPLGVKGGAETVVLTPANLPSHNHTFSANNSAATTNQPAGNWLSVLQDTGNPGSTVLAYLPYNTSDKTAAKVQLHPATIGNSGSAQPVAHENRQSYLCLNYIIATAGLYPSFTEIEGDSQQAAPEEM